MTPLQTPRDGDSLHVAITVDPNIPVPPKLYGGIERVVDFLLRGLVDRGHRVTLFAHPESVVAAELQPYGVPPHTGIRARVSELAQVGSALWRRRASFDLVHSFGRLAALVPILPLRRLPKLQTYQRESVPWRSVGIARRLAGRSVAFTACSGSVYAAKPATEFSAWYTVYNGVDITKYTPTTQVPSDAPLAFLGRLEPIKGVHHAIEIARRSGRRLVIAGNRVETGGGAGYFDREIAPHLDGDRVQYIGPVNDTQKNALLGSSAALLMPIEWEEPFGIVMAEALACATPVIGFARGSVPEVVRDGVNGYACRTVDDAVNAVAAIGRIDRQAVRADCEHRFSATAIVDRYEELYRLLLREVRGVRTQTRAASTMELRA